MLAYSTKDGILYSTDGCNACAHRAPLDQLKKFAEDNELRPELVEHLLSLL